VTLLASLLCCGYVSEAQAAVVAEEEEAEEEEAVEERGCGS